MKQKKSVGEKKEKEKRNVKKKVGNEKLGETLCRKNENSGGNKRRYKPNKCC